MWRMLSVLLWNRGDHPSTQASARVQVAVGQIQTAGQAPDQGGAAGQASRVEGREAPEDGSGPGRGTDPDGGPRQ